MFTRASGEERLRVTVRNAERVYILREERSPFEAAMKELKRNPVKHCRAAPRADNIHEWTAVINGPENTVYEGGTFFVQMFVPPTYPFSSPKANSLICNKIFLENALLENIAEQYVNNRKEFDATARVWTLRFAQ
uniref:UBIQUITIN_CONJUGAT_2 domain-containing protein n=1 Tax=Elaeophora elaphi TaxID=1147741 RepID=A0A0R3RR25_9BILA